MSEPTKGPEESAAPPTPTSSAEEGSPPPPRTVELLVGPFRGLAIYGRAAGVSVWTSFGLLVLVATGCGLLLAAAEWVDLRGEVGALRDTALWLMPRVTVDGGTATVEGPPGRLLDVGDFVLLVDPVSENPVFPDAAVGDTRPRLLVGREGLLLFRSDRPPTMLPWAELNAARGRLSLDGPELVDWIEALLPALLGALASVVLAIFLVYQSLVLLVLSALYRRVFFRGPSSPALSVLFGAGCLASLPVVALATVLLGVGLTQGAAFSVHIVGLGGLFFLAASRVRFSAIPVGAGDSGAP